MIQATSDYVEFEEIEKLINACSNPRDRAFIALLARTGIRISEAIKLETSDIDSKRGTLTITHLKERMRLKCPHCGESLGKKHLFCPGCGNKVGEALRADMGLDVKKLQILLGHADIGTTMEYVDSSFEQLRSEYEKLWESKEDETKETAD